MVVAIAECTYRLCGSDIIYKYENNLGYTIDQSVFFTCYLPKRCQQSIEAEAFIVALTFFFDITLGGGEGWLTARASANSARIVITYVITQ